MKRIFVSSPKGGCGKSTLSRNLAVTASLEGLTVATVDLDAQEALTRWYYRRPEGRRTFAHYAVALDDAGPLVEDEAIDPVDLMIIDTPPGVEQNPEVMKALAMAADLVLVPCRPSYDDVDSCVPYLRALRERTRNLAVVVNGVNPSVNIAVEKEMLLAAGVDVCPVEIGLRTDNHRASGRGLAVADSGACHPGATEYRALWRFCQGRIGLQSKAAAEPLLKRRSLRSSKKDGTNVAAA
jgi:chromosome partitioning protein